MALNSELRPFYVLCRILWGASAAAVLPIFLPTLLQRLPVIPHTHVDVVSGAAAACSFIGEMFMLKALLVFEPRQHKLKKVRPRIPIRDLPLKSARKHIQRLRGMQIADVHFRRTATLNLANPPAHALIPSTYSPPIT